MRSRAASGFVAATAAALASVICVSVWPAGAALNRDQHTHHPAQRPTLARTIHAPFGNCAAKDITMLLSVPRLTFTAHQTVTIDAIVTNTGPTACGFSGFGPIPSAVSVASTPLPTQSIGPCGSMELQFDNAQGVDIWPGHAAFSCPAGFEYQLLPGTHLRAVGSWGQGLMFPLHGAAPKGNYRLLVDGRVASTITLR
jgi:hypothetical protein